MDQLRLAGAPVEVLAAAEAAAEVEQDFFEVWEDCFDSLKFFLGLRSRWLYASSGMGSVRVGLDPKGLDMELTYRGGSRRRRARLFEDVRLMEQAVLDVDAEQRKASGDKQREGA